MRELPYVTLPRATFRVFADQLAVFFGEQVTLRGHCLEDGTDVSARGAGLVLLSSRDVLSKLAGSLDSIPHLTSRRTLDPSKLVFQGVVSAMRQQSDLLREVESCGPGRTVPRPLPRKQGTWRCSRVAV